MKGDEFRIILEDINEKFDILIEGQNLSNEKIDRQVEENKGEFKDLRKDMLFLKKDVLGVKRDVSDLRKDLNEHRENTELHGVKKKKKVS